MAFVLEKFEDMEKIYQAAKKVYDHEITKEEAAKGLMTQTKAKAASLKMYFDIYACMRKGKCYKLGTSAKFTKFLLEQIYSEFGYRALITAITAAKCHSEYRASVNNEQPGIAKVCKDVIREKCIDLDYESLPSYHVEEEVPSLLDVDKGRSTDYTFGITMSIGEGKVSIKDDIKRINNYITFNGFTYENGLIENFYLSLKSKPFVILAGTSGTGKTRLVRLFAEAVGATPENGRYKMVPVRPDWSDSSDLFGHVDLNGNFVPGAIIDFVKKAELDGSYPYFLCLDEMNLARVEYYLSDILSVIETRDFKDGRIQSSPLIDHTYYGADTAAAGRYGTVLLPENLYIIGTVNMDETTFPFSRKVLDRANTIEFSFVDLMPNFETVTSNSPQALNLNNTFLKTEFLLLSQCSKESESVSGYCLELQKINKILQQANAHVGYRVRDEIVFYLLNNKKYDLLPEEQAMDNELMQKILPRIQGSSLSVKTMLCELFKLCAGDYDGYQVQNDNVSDKMSKALRDTNRKIKYRHSAEKIELMIRRFEEDGFTSYWL